MAMRRIFALTVISVARVMATSSALTCPTGQTTGVSGDTCCTCEVGFAQPDCVKCKPGYLFDNSTGTPKCRNGITDCDDNIAYPHGCSGNGKCAQDAQGYYSCTCNNGYTGLGCQIAPAGGAGNSSSGASCHPAGVNLVTQSPLEVTYGEPFNLLMWGCELKDGDSYRIIPESKNCSEAVTEPACRVTAAELKSGSKSVGQACTSVEVTGSTTISGGNQAAIEGLKLTAEDQGNMYKICRKADGATDFSGVTTHDERGYRNPTFIAVPAAQANAYQAAALYEAQSGEDWKCCDELEIRIGDICLPLWVWLLLMLLILAAIAYLLYKNHQLGKEIEMERNNRQFVADVGDDSALKLDAAKRAGADDDV